MKQIIETSFTRNEVDSFLKKRYGFGIWEFDHSLVYIYSLYFEKKEKKVFHFIEKRIRKLEDIKRKIIELIDDFSADMNLYKLHNEFESTRIIKWTPKERYKFIAEKYKLSSFYSVINRLIKKYKEHGSYLKKDGTSKIINFRVYLKPINLAVLIWSHAMKRGKKVDWINMENLLNWFTKKLNEMGMLSFYEFNNGCAPLFETLRMTWNKYKNTKYDSLSKSIFLTFFKIAKDEGKEKFPKPLNELDEYLKWEDKSLDHINKLTDILVLGWFILEDSRIKD